MVLAVRQTRCQTAKIKQDLNLRGQLIPNNPCFALELKLQPTFAFHLGLFTQTAGNTRRMPLFFRHKQTQLAKHSTAIVLWLTNVNSWLVMFTRAASCWPTLHVQQESTLRHSLNTHFYPRLIKYSWVGIQCKVEWMKKYNFSEDTLFEHFSFIKVLITIKKEKNTFRVINEIVWFPRLFICLFS